MNTGLSHWFFIKLNLFMSFMSLASTPVSVLESFEGLKELEKSSQVLVVKPSAVGRPILQFFEKQNKKWNLLFETPVIIGKKGFAPRGGKVEGDLKTPSGIFSLGTSWGYASSLKDTKMPYLQATSEDKFIDDPESEQYNQWVRGETKAKSFELMKRKDGVYEYGIVINYNMNPVVKGKGSAIFLHIWRSQEDTTLGCVAMAKSELLKLLSLLDPAKNPQIILNP